MIPSNPWCITIVACFPFLVGKSKLFVFKAQQEEYLTKQYQVVYNAMYCMCLSQRINKTTEKNRLYFLCIFVVCGSSSYKWSFIKTMSKDEIADFHRLYQWILWSGLWNRILKDHHSMLLLSMKYRYAPSPLGYHKFNFFL